MTRSSVCLLVPAVLLAGCTEAYHPVKRDSTSTTAPADGKEMAGDFHGSGGGFHGSATASGDLHGTDFHGTNFHGTSSHGTAAAAQPEPYKGKPDDPVAVGDLQLTAPAGWTRQQPRSQFVQAEFTLPNVQGDPQDGRLTVSLAGGSVDANVERWRGQFGEKPEREAKQQLEVAGLKVTVVDFTGTYNDQQGPFAPGVERKGYRMLGAIIPVGEQLHFVKAYGPQKTMTEHEDAFHAFVQSVKKQ